MIQAYEPTEWISGVTRLSPENMNHIEQGIVNIIRAVGAAGGIAPISEEGKIPEEFLPEQKGTFDFDAYTGMTGYAYSFDKDTMVETITYENETFATRTNTKNADGSWTIAVLCESMNIASTKQYVKDASGNWSSSDI